jgi:hypothetical protein
MAKLPDFRRGTPRPKREPDRRKGPPPEGLLSYLARMHEAEMAHRGEGEERERRFRFASELAAKQDRDSAEWEASLSMPRARLPAADEARDDDYEEGD